MADEVYFFSESYTYKSAAVATSSGGSDVSGREPEYAIDYDMDTQWENDAALPVLKIDLGAAYAIDSLWFKHGNIDTFTLYYSTDDISYFAVSGGTAGSGGVAEWLFAFTEQTARYWRLNVTAKIGGGNASVYDVLLMKQRLAITSIDNLPADIIITPIDRAGGGYEMANGTMATYSGSRDYADIDMVFAYTPVANRDNLYGLYSVDAGGFRNIREPLVIFPESDYPEKIYRVLWGDINFPLKRQISYKDAGYGGTLQFQEY